MTRRLQSAASTLVLVAAACSQTLPAASVAPSTGQAASAAVPSAAPSTGRSPSALPLASPKWAEGPIDLQAGEPWLLYGWYPKSLFLVRPDGADRHRLDLGAEGDPIFPSWSPDGQRIAFVLRVDGAVPGDSRDSIWSANADGTDAKPFYDGDRACDGHADYPVWSPDGKRMALICSYIEDGKGISTVAVLDLATMHKTELVRLWPEFIDNPPSWSPDGKTIAFDILTWDPTDTVVTSQLVATVPAAGGKVERLTDPALFGSHPDWSPDGTLLAFNTYDTGNTHGTSNPSNVYTIRPDGSGLRQLSTASTDGKMRLGQPSWSTDGTRIWVSIARDWEKDSTGQFMNTLGWVDAATGEFREIGTEGKRFVERPR